MVLSRALPHHYEKPRQRRSFYSDLLQVFHFSHHPSSTAPLRLSFMSSFLSTTLVRWGEHLGRIDVAFAPDSGKVLAYTGAPIRLTEEYPQGANSLVHPKTVPFPSRLPAQGPYGMLFFDGACLFLFLRSSRQTSPRTHHVLARTL
jgi:hypothetical protein